MITHFKAFIKEIQLLGSPENDNEKEIMHAHPVQLMLCSLIEELSIIIHSYTHNTKLSPGIYIYQNMATMFILTPYIVIVWCAYLYDDGANSRQES